MNGIDNGELIVDNKTTGTDLFIIIFLNYQLPIFHYQFLR